MFAALLSPPGRGAIAVVHAGGEGARALVEGWVGRPLDARPRAGVITDVDEVLCRVVEGFTGEETIEITCHGGTAVVDRLLQALAEKGAQVLSSEELLDRAVERGRMDRLQAEAWAALAEAKTELAAKTLRDQADGALSSAVRAMASPADAGRLLETASLGRALAKPPRVVLAGSPNAGKSTLFNALVERDRAIVSPEAGTTRDPVREVVAIEQVPLELVDTAGVEDARDALEAAAIERTYRALSGADLVVFLFDAEAGARGGELRLLERLADRRVVLAVNKVDAGAKKPLLQALPISAKSGQGLDELRRKILWALDVRPRYTPGAPVVFTERQQKLLASAARGDLELAREALLGGPSDSAGLP